MADTDDINRGNEDGDILHDDSGNDVILAGVGTDMLESYVRAATGVAMK